MVNAVINSPCSQVAAPARAWKEVVITDGNARTLGAQQAQMALASSGQSHGPDMAREADEGGVWFPTRRPYSEQPSLRVERPLEEDPSEHSASRRIGDQQARMAALALQGSAKGRSRGSTEPMPSRLETVEGGHACPVCGEEVGVTEVVRLGTLVRLSGKCPACGCRRTTFLNGVLAALPSILQPHEILLD